MITPAELRKVLEEQQSITVLDARGSAAYRREDVRVAGDRRVSSADVYRAARCLDRKAWVLTYCTCTNDGLAARVAARLQAMGFSRARAVEGGLEGCRAAGLEIVGKPRSHPGTQPCD